MATGKTDYNNIQLVLHSVQSVLPYKVTLKERTRFLKAEETHKCDAALTFSMGDSIKPEFRGDSRNISLSAVSPCLERISRTCWFYLATAHVQRPFPETHRVNIMPITFLSTGCVDISLYAQVVESASQTGVPQPGHFIRNQLSF